MGKSLEIFETGLLEKASEILKKAQKSYVKGVKDLLSSLNELQFEDEEQEPSESIYI